MSSSTQAAGVDTDIAKITEVTTPTELGDVLTVPLAYVDKSPIPIEWSQNFKSRSDTYYQLAFTNTSKSKSLKPPCRHASKLSL